MVSFKREFETGCWAISAFLGGLWTSAMVTTRLWSVVEPELDDGVKGSASGLRLLGFSFRSCCMWFSRALAEAWRKVVSLWGIGSISCLGRWIESILGRLANPLLEVWTWHFLGKWSKSSGSSSTMRHLRTVASSSVRPGVLVLSGFGLSWAVMALRRTKVWIARSFGLGHVSWPGF